MIGSKVIVALCMIGCASLVASEEQVSEYINQFDSVKDSVDQHTVEIVSQMVQNQLKHAHSENAWSNAQQLMAFGEQKHSISEPIREVRDELKQLAAGNADVKFLEPQATGFIYAITKMNNPKVEKLVQKAMVEPCQQHNTPLEQVFSAAESDSSSKTQLNQDRVDFYQAWARFRFCEQMKAQYGEIVKGLVGFGGQVAQIDRVNNAVSENFGF